MKEPYEIGDNKMPRAKVRKKPKRLKITIEGSERVLLPVIQRMGKIGSVKIRVGGKEVKGSCGSATNPTWGIKPK